MSTATTHIKTDKQLVPVLRFKEFDGEWENNRLYDLSNLITKGTTPKTFTDSGVNYVKIEGLVGININKDKCLFIDEEVHLKELKRSILQEVDLLFAIAGATVGKVGIVTTDILPANTNQALAIIRLKNKEYLNYILQILQSRVMKKYIYQSVSVGAQPNLNLEQIGDFRFNIPQLPEQQKIAFFLSAVDEKIQQLTRKKNLLEQYKKGVMQQIFSGQLRFKDENGNPYPDWEEKRLNEFCTFFSGGTPTSSFKEYYSGEIPFIGSGNIYDSEVFSFISKEALDSSSAKLVERGDLLYALYGANSGESAISKLEGAINQAILCIRTKESIEYLNYILVSNKDKIVSKYLQGGQGNLSAQIIKKLKYKFPCLEEQQKIATYLSSIDTKIESVNNQITQTQTFKKGLLQQMFV